MSLLEIEDNGSGVPQGVVLAIVGPSLDSANPSKETDTAKTVRMYNLASLVNLARWTISQKVRLRKFSISLSFTADPLQGAKPLDLYSVSSLQVPASTKRHRPQGSIARSLM